MSAIAERAVALAVAREIERDDRDAFAPRVGPDVDLGPMQDRMDAQMRAGRRRGVELVPEFRRLVASRPTRLRAPRGENTRSLARVGSSSRRMPAIRPSKLCLASASFSPSVLRAAERAAGGSVGSTASIGGHGSIEEVEIPLRRVAVAERVHLRKLLAGVDMHHRKRHAPEERLARDPDHHVGVFAERPEQREPFSRANASRKMKMLCASRSSSRSTLATPWLRRDGSGRLRATRRAVGSVASRHRVAKKRIVFETTIFATCFMQGEPAYRK